MEFKKLGEVTLVEEALDTANVLIEENGEIKRVPKTEVGGAGGYVIQLGKSSVTIGDAYPFNCSDNYDELYDILMAGGSVWIDTEGAPESAAPVNVLGSSANSPTNFGSQKILVGYWQLTDIGLLVGDIWDDCYILFPNGSHNLPPIGNNPQ